MDEQETKMITDEKDHEMEMYTEDVDENWEDLDSDIAQETLRYMKMTLATKLPQHHELEATRGKEQSWREGTLIQRNVYALATGNKSDCSFQIRDGNELWVFPCHVLPLSWASSKLEKMLEETKTHELLDVEPRHFLKLLEFVYTDATTLDNIDTAFGVWSVANKLDVKSLAPHCASRVREQMTAKDVCQALEFARYSEDSYTEQFCIKFIREHTSAVLAKETWSKISRDTLETILSQDELNCTSELELFRACVRWVTASSPDQTARDVLGSVLGLIRFRTFSTRDFATFVCPTKLLTDGEQSAIFCCLATNSAIMPAGFSRNRKSRGRFVVVESAVSVAIGTRDFEESRPASKLNTEGVTSWLNSEYNQPGGSTSNVSYAESLHESLEESYTGNGSDQIKSKADEISQPIVQGKLVDLMNNGHLGLKKVVHLRHIRESLIPKSGHYILNNPFTFSVNISAYIMFVELYSWKKDHELARSKESVFITLKLPNGKAVVKGVFKGNVSRKDFFKVYCCRPFCLTPNVTYKLYLQFDDPDALYCGYPIVNDRAYKTCWGLEVNILDGSCSQVRGLQFAKRMLPC